MKSWTDPTWVNVGAPVVKGQCTALISKGFRHFGKLMCPSFILVIDVFVFVLGRSKKLDEKA